MRKLFLGSVAVLALTGAAGAADLAYKAAPIARAAPGVDWSGFYLGINGGYGRSENCWDLHGANVPVSGGGGTRTIEKSEYVGSKSGGGLGSAFTGISSAFSPALAEGCNNGNGAIFGGHVGYRQQVNNFVFGIEAQGDWADLKGSNTSAVFNGLTLPAGAALSLVNTSKVDAIGLFTGQVGYSFGSVLWYVKGGAAVTNNQYDGNLNASFSRGTTPIFTLNATDHASAVRFGGVVGTGVDVMFAPGWSVGIEYDHLFMGDQQVGFAYTGASGTGALAGIRNPAGIPSRNETISGDIDMATVRLNYSFGR